METLEFTVDYLVGVPHPQIGEKESWEVADGVLTIPGGMVVAVELLWPYKNGWPQARLKVRTGRYAEATYTRRYDAPRGQAGKLEAGETVEIYGGAPNPEYHYDTVTLPCGATVKTLCSGTPYKPATIEIAYNLDSQAALDAAIRQ